MTEPQSAPAPVTDAAREVDADDRPARPEPGRWAVSLGLLPTMLVLALWVYSASDGWSYTWFPRQGVSRSLGAVDGKIRFTQIIRPSPRPPGPGTYRALLGFRYTHTDAVAAPGGVTSATTTTTVPIWALLVVALVPAAMVSRRRPPTAPITDVPMARRHT